MTAKLATVNDRALARAEEAGTIRDEGTMQHDAPKKPQVALSNSTVEPAAPHPQMLPLACAIFGVSRTQPFLGRDALAED